MLKESMKSIGSECDVVSFSPLGSKVEEESSIYEYYVTKTETQKLEDLCFSAVGIIVTVVIFVAGLGCMMYANKISKEVNQELEDENN